MELFFDVETTTYNKGHVYDPRNQLVSYSLRWGTSPASFHYYTDPDFISVLRDALGRCTRIIGFAIKFDLAWARKVGVDLNEDCEVWDCQIAEFVITGQQAIFTNLDACLSSYGLPQKIDRIAEYWAKGIQTTEVPVKELEEYNNWDVDITKMLYESQCAIIPPEQYNLVIQEGYDLLTLLDAEWNGQKFDVAHALAEVQQRTNNLEAIKQQLNGYLPAGIPEQTPFNWNSGDQLSALLYGGVVTYEYPVPTEAIYKSGTRKGEAYVRNRWVEYKIIFPRLFTPIEGTEVKKSKDQPSIPEMEKIYQVDDPTLRLLKTKDKNAKNLIYYLQKQASETKVLEMTQSVLNLIETYGWGEYLHPQFHQHTTRTGRLSSSKPNGQNQPPEIDALIVSRYD